MPSSSTGDTAQEYALHTQYAVATAHVAYFSFIDRTGTASFLKAHIPDLFIELLDADPAIEYSRSARDALSALHDVRPSPIQALESLVMTILRSEQILRQMGRGKEANDTLAAAMVVQCLVTQLQCREQQDLEGRMDGMEVCA